MQPTTHFILAAALLSTVTASLLPAHFIWGAQTLHLAPTLRSDKCPVRLEEDQPVTTQARAAVVAHNHPSQVAQPRIVNGDEASPNLAPYVVSILKSGKASCTGTLVSARWVISAAHCAINTSHEVLIGARRTSDGAAQGAKLVGIKEVVEHEKYEGERGRRFDIAAIELEEDAPETAKFMKVNVNARVPQAHSYARVLGYGKMAEGSDDPAGEAGKLRQVDVPVTSEDTCIDVYSAVDPKAQVCAGYVGKGECDSCQGDSGGPMIQYNELGEPVLVGIVSAGTGCARKGYPGIYMRVSAFATWLESQAGVSFQKTESIKAVFRRSSNRTMIVRIVAPICVGVVLIGGVALLWFVWWRLRRGKSDEENCKRGAQGEREERVVGHESEGFADIEEGAMGGHGEGISHVAHLGGDTRTGTDGEWGEDGRNGHEVGTGLEQMDGEPRISMPGTGQRPSFGEAGERGSPR